jgi:hypothetical protein
LEIKSEVWKWQQFQPKLFFDKKFGTVAEAYRFKNCCQDSNIKHIAVQFERSYYHTPYFSQLIY